MKPEDENWFTDGGCIRNGTKDAIAAFAIIGKKGIFRKSGILEGEYKTSYEAELVAITECLNEIDQINDNKINVIFTDSLAIIKAVINNKIEI